MPLTGRDTANFYNIWERLNEQLIHDNRFFNLTAKEILDDFFSGIKTVKLPNGDGLILKIGLDNEIKDIYRARSFSSLTEVPKAIERPDIHIGPPPYKFAGNGRLNSKHQSIFYGSFDEETMFAEIRPSVSSYIVYSKFEPLKELNILNLSELRCILENGTVYDSIEKGNRCFLANMMFLGEHMTKPVQPENNTIEYIVTQAIADYLSSINIDGIAYRSAQNKRGINIAIFHKSSQVEDIVNKSEINHSRLINYQLGGIMNSDVPLNEETATLHRILDKKRDIISIEVVNKSTLTSIKKNHSKKFDTRQPTLKTTKESVKIKYIDSVKFDYSEVPWKSVLEERVTHNNL